MKVSKSTIFDISSHDHFVMSNNHRMVPKLNSQMGDTLMASTVGGVTKGGVRDSRKSSFESALRKASYQQKLISPDFTAVPGAAVNDPRRMQFATNVASSLTHISSAHERDVS